MGETGSSRDSVESASISFTRVSSKIICIMDGEDMSINKESTPANLTVSYAKLHVVVIWVSASQISACPERGRLAEFPTQLLIPVTLVRWVSFRQVRHAAIQAMLIS